MLLAEFTVWSSTVLDSFESRMLYAAALRVVRDGYLMLRRPDQADGPAPNAPIQLLPAGKYCYWCLTCCVCQRWALSTIPGLGAGYHSRVRV